MCVVAWVSMVIAGSLGWTLVGTHHVGVKPALVRPDRPSREPELDGHDDLEDVHQLREPPTSRARPSAPRTLH
jgi:hypothetical protein